MKSGLVFMDRGWHLGYGWEHGGAQWMPHRAQRLIVAAWNRLACLVFGHDYAAFTWEFGLNPVPECSACLSVLLVGRVVATIPEPMNHTNWIPV